MIPRSTKHTPGLLAATVAIGLLLAAGCSEQKPPSIRIANPWLGHMRIAVAPALNFSGSPDFDPNAVADIMASELAHVDGMEVLPVSRVLAVLAQQGLSRVEGPEHAREIVERLGADGILVFAVTEYDPYEPPVVGIAAQLYGGRPQSRVAGFDPVLVSRSATNTAVRTVESAESPLAGTTRVFNAAAEVTTRQVEAYAKARTADESPMGWQKYLASQQHYLRFCCYATIKELVQHGVNRDVADHVP